MTSGTPHKNIRGNVLFLILIGIAVFASMTFGIMQSQRGGTMNLDQEKLANDIDKIISYGAAIERSLNALLLQSGCDITEVSFDHTDSSVYDTNGYYKNPNAPGDYSCHVFNPSSGVLSGGGIEWKTPPSIAQDNGSSEYGFYGHKGVAQLGRSDGRDGIDLIMGAKLSYDACVLVNEKAGVDNPGGDPPSYSGSFDFPLVASQTFPIAGSGPSNQDGFISGGYIGTGGQANEVAGHKMGCIYSTSDSEYDFYYVVLAR